METGVKLIPVLDLASPAPRVNDPKPCVEPTVPEAGTETELIFLN